MRRILQPILLLFDPKNPNLMFMPDLLVFDAGVHFADEVWTHRYVLYHEMTHRSEREYRPYMLGAFPVQNTGYSYQMVIPK